jgi:hypothetical protein
VRTSTTSWTGVHAVRISRLHEIDRWQHLKGKGWVRAESVAKWPRTRPGVPTQAQNRATGGRTDVPGGTCDVINRVRSGTRSAVGPLGQPGRERTRTWTGTHTAKGYTTEAGETTSVECMKADCDNIDLNKKLAAGFRSDIFGQGMKRFFCKCQKVGPDTNKYWFTSSSADQAQIDKLCDPTTTYLIV